ncbi:50S ribosomal protein L10 [Plasmodium brasilianum]|uniref:50S ribosomal protein L10, putative n=2 Tax=Plasmodium (Plasmodium) TaxID=418103 RepID=A0A1D3JLK5_PLAMA|nr:50S ribosomal protein L10, putative [Plasmodium malariae]KAI4840073.1 50S ribosomal protein L10 [Plasmodium brasilianum]SBT87436.1 50S ribosomal protein L10, putative [Plasmodium malariae]
MYIRRINIKYLSFSLLLYFIYRTNVPNHSEKNFKYTNTFEGKTPFISATLVKKNGKLLTRQNIITCFLKKKIFTNNSYIGEEKRKKKISYFNRKFSLKSRKCSGYRNTREGKEEIVRKVKRILKVTKLLIQLNSFKLTPNLRMDLLINMPRPHVRIHMVKNTLMKLAVKNTPFEAVTPFLKESNVYLFIMDENYISFSLYRNKMFCSLYKEYKLNNVIKVAVYENTVLNKKETEDLINLKSYNVYFGHIINKINKIITSIPSSIMQIPSSIAKGIYLHSQKKE